MTFGSLIPIVKGEFTTPSTDPLPASVVYSSVTSLWVAPTVVGLDPERKEATEAAANSASPATSSDPSPISTRGNVRENFDGEGFMSLIRVDVFKIEG